jgi:hypothetical protein
MNGMIQLILFLGIAALLLVSLFLLARRSPRPEGGAEALVEARQALTQLQTSLLPQQLVNRFFAEADFEYVASAAPGPVNALFRRERKRIVLAWVDEVHRQIQRLRRFHLGAARFYARMGLRSEISLAMDFATLLIACRALQVLVYVGGPRVAPPMFGATAAAGMKICQVYEEALAFLSTSTSMVDRSIAS